ncbi:Aldehyde dehydrogenase family protein [Ruegeria marina]|uniref:Aldehyde dehydrogenase family protein n=1 Tax=Ruegeria marina TaxID=639004 RepID=A0A1G7EYH3_9RHOB|nr:Aldehyde dehydrogenase family protein [Ruegeria marina]
MTSNRMISTYFETGTLPDLPRDHFIDGAFVAADSGNRMESFDAGTGEAFADFAAGTAADVDRAVTSAAASFEVWRNTPPARRCAILNEAARLFAERTVSRAPTASLELQSVPKTALGCLPSLYWAMGAAALSATWSLPSKKCCEMRERPECESCIAASRPVMKVGKGPFTPSPSLRRHILHLFLQQQRHLFSGELVPLSVGDALRRDRVLRPAGIDSRDPEGVAAGAELSAKVSRRQREGFSEGFKSQPFGIERAPIWERNGYAKP